jgi:threonine synthase
MLYETSGLGALEILLRRGAIKPSERILIFNTGASQKYPEAVQEKLPRLDVTKPIDWDSL